MLRRIKLLTYSQSHLSLFIVLILFFIEEKEQDLKNIFSLKAAVLISI